MQFQQQQIQQHQHKNSSQNSKVEEEEVTELIKGGDRVLSSGERNRSHINSGLIRRTPSLVPPPLMAAVFPWDRGGGRTGDGTQWQAEASDEDRASCTKKGRGGCQRRKVENHTIPGGGGRHTIGGLLGGAVQWRNLPFLEFENGKKEGTTAITIPSDQ
ncbi:hypothetical protein PIB30_003467 [Stylosanthes scabra]|uniref:Uncharacterized protein n=1 Tax=Stylosanthes scabra TaxID=79078 RepID=A0ABU6V4R1_9FABA|nr:hypothetical protein [Stylosanthes scabra]